jgi:hypothetical protein
MPGDNGDDLLHERINIRGEIENIRAVLGEREKLDDEREKRLNERFEAQEKAVVAAFAAAKESVTVALSAAEKAVEKAEASQLRVNMTQNEFRGTLADQNATVERTMMPRAETELLVKDLRGRIDDLSGTRREGVGQSADVLARLTPILIAAVALIVSIYLAAH